MWEVWRPYLWHHRIFVYAFGAYCIGCFIAPQFTNFVPAFVAVVLFTASVVLSFRVRTRLLKTRELSVVEGNQVVGYSIALAALGILVSGSALSHVFEGSSRIEIAVGAVNLAIVLGTALAFEDSIRARFAGKKHDRK